LELHLSDQQIAELVDATREATAGQAADRRQKEDGRLHLQVCENCSQRFREQESAMVRLDRLKPEFAAAPGPQCPSAEVWLEIVAGVKPSETEAYLNHAIQCDYCGPLLRQAAADLDDQLTAQQVTSIASLHTATPTGQRELAAVLRAAHSRSGYETFQSWRRWAEPRQRAVQLVYAASVVMILAGSGWLWLRQRQANSPEVLIAKAYIEKRTLEVRFDGAPYVPLRQERGSDHDRMARPALLKAESAIAQHLKSNEDDVKWLQAGGRADLLEGDASGSERALSIFQKARELDPDNQSLTIDIASAYLLRGQLDARNEDIGKAVDLLGRVLAAEPNREVAQFNYSLALEALNLNEKAISSWNHFLQSHPNSSWAPEVHQHLERLQGKVGSYNERRGEPLLTVDAVAAAFSARRQRDIEKIDSRIEDYQNVAIREWLPSYFGKADSDDPMASVRKAALLGLASLLREQHGDRWLNDLLDSGSASPRMARAAFALARSEILIEKSDDRGAQASAQTAARMFRESHSSAGELRARLIFAYILQMQHQARKCEAAAGDLARTLISTPYRWLQVQNNLERAACASTSDIRVLDLAEAARMEAGEHRYPDLEIRADNFIAGFYQVVGNRHDAWSRAISSLQEFWNGHYDAKRGFNLLTDLDNLADDQEEWFLDQAVLEEEEPLVVRDPNVAVRAVAMERLGQARLRVGEIAAAEDSFRDAQETFKKVPSGFRRDALNAEVQLNLARAELKSKRLNDATAQLEQIRSVILQIPDDDLQLEFFQTAGISELQNGQLDQASDDLNAAIRLAENGLSLVQTEADRWRWRNRNEPEYRALIELDLKFNGRQALQDWELFKGATLRTGSQGGDTPLKNQPSTRNGTRDLVDLGPDTLLISYFVAPDRTTVWIGNLNRNQSIPISVSEPELSLLVRRFAEHCSDPTSSAEVVQRESSILYNKLILPFEASLDGYRNLVIEPDGMLRNLPFEVLIDGHHQYLGDRFAVVISPGIEYLDRSAQWPGVTRANNALIIGNPEVPGWSSLPEAEQEARTVAAMFQKPQLLLHESGAEADIASAIAGAQVFHFSGHAAVNAVSASLEVGDSSAALPFNIDTSRTLRTRLVVLSACSSALGTGGHFDDEDSFVRRLLAARVPTVVASRWEVDSGATATLMKVFYINLLQGHSVSASLASARREIRSIARFDHPYYWAAFSVFGKG
jgi:CHAT domain-containing protein